MKVFSFSFSFQGNLIFNCFFCGSDVWGEVADSLASVMLSMFVEYEVYDIVLGFKNGQRDKKGVLGRIYNFEHSSTEPSQALLTNEDTTNALVQTLESLSEIHAAEDDTSPHKHKHKRSLSAERRAEKNRKRKNKKPKDVSIDLDDSFVDKDFEEEEKKSASHLPALVAPIREDEKADNINNNNNKEKSFVGLPPIK